MSRPSRGEGLGCLPRLPGVYRLTWSEVTSRVCRRLGWINGGVGCRPMNRGWPAWRPEACYERPPLYLATVRSLGSELAGEDYGLLRSKFVVGQYPPVAKGR
jgi:hypothetical protein